MCRVPSDCRRVSVWSDGRTEIQPCRAAAQACVRGPDETGVVWIPKVGSREARREDLVDEMFSGLQSLRVNVCKSGPGCSKAG